MIAAVDTSILLDVFVDNDHATQSEALLVHAYERGSLIIAQAVYAELAPQTQSQAELDRWLIQIHIDVVPFTREHAYFAGQAHAAYRRAGGKRDRVLADFFIGAHALCEAGALLTRDRGFYREYFADLEILSGPANR